MAESNTGTQFKEVLEILEELNVQAERLIEAATNAKIYLTSEGEHRDGTD